MGQGIMQTPRVIQTHRSSKPDGYLLGSRSSGALFAREQQERVGLFEKYIPELAQALHALTGEKKVEIEEHLEKRNTWQGRMYAS